MYLQKKVVIEEFKQRYLNQPYGDWNLLLRPLAYSKHPYMWPTIGKEISHIENANLAIAEQQLLKLQKSNISIKQKYHCTKLLEKIYLTQQNFNIGDKKYKHNVGMLYYLIYNTNRIYKRWQQILKR